MLCSICGKVIKEPAVIIKAERIEPVYKDEKTSYICKECEEEKTSK